MTKKATNQNKTLIGKIIPNNLKELVKTSKSLFSGGKLITPPFVF